MKNTYRSLLCMIALLIGGTAATHAEPETLTVSGEIQNPIPYEVTLTENEATGNIGNIDVKIEGNPVGVTLTCRNQYLANYAMPESISVVRSGRITTISMKGREGTYHSLRLKIVGYFCKELTISSGVSDPETVVFEAEPLFGTDTLIPAQPDNSTVIIVPDNTSNPQTPTLELNEPGTIAPLP